MTNDAIIQIARRAYKSCEHIPNVKIPPEFIERFAKLVEQQAKAEEREACAEVCKKHADVYAGLEQNSTTQSAWAACIDNSDAILAKP
jgi:5,10-methylenetetrahydrofolate reductase